MGGRYVIKVFQILKKGDTDQQQFQFLRPLKYWDTNSEYIIQTGRLVQKSGDGRFIIGVLEHWSCTRNFVQLCSSKEEKIEQVT
jgi:hypothetical protein